MWSLAVEEQFYLLAPLIVWWLSPRRLRVVLVGIVCGVPFIRAAMLFHVHQIDSTRVMPSNADALALGMLAAIVWRSPASRSWLQRNVRLSSWIAAALLAGCVLQWWYAADFGRLPLASAGLTWIAMFYALLVLIVLSDPHRWLARVMRVGWLRSVGRVSYCMYIIHLVVDLFCHALILHTRPRIVGWPGACVSLLAAVLTYALASASWKLFERPLVRIGHGFMYWSPEEGEGRADARVMSGQGKRSVAGTGGSLVRETRFPPPARRSWKNLPRTIHFLDSVSLKAKASAQEKTN